MIKLGWPFRICLLNVCRKTLFSQVAQTGYRTEGVGVSQGFKRTKRSRYKAPEILRNATYIKIRRSDEG
jgi:hypothetical protein